MGPVTGGAALRRRRAAGVTLDRYTASPHVTSNRRQLRFRTIHVTDAGYVLSSLRCRRWHILSPGRGAQVTCVGLRVTPVSYPAQRPGFFVPTLPFPCVVAMWAGRDMHV